MPIIYGKALPQSKRISGNIPVYGSNGIVDFHNSSCVNTAGVIIGRKGSVGAIHLSEKPFWVIDTAFYIVNDDLEELKFTYYLLKTLGLSEMNSDSAVPGLNRENAHSLKNKKYQKIKFHRCEIGKRLSILTKKSNSTPKSTKPWKKSPKPCLKAGLSISIPCVLKSKRFQTALALNKQSWQAMQGNQRKKHPKN